MRRTAVVALRAGIVLAFAAAVADLPLPAGRANRRRVHLIDRSLSVQVPGGPSSITPREARELAEADRRAADPRDAVAWIAFGRDTAVESEAVDPAGTDLEGALEAALARNPTEIVLHSDGRGEPGDALLLARARGVPVHVVALGPVDVRDARLARVDAPSELDPGETGTVEVVVESTFAAPATLRLGDEARPLALAPGVPTAVRFRRGAGAYDLRLDVDDAAPANNATRVVLLERGRARPVLVLGPPLAVPDADVAVSADFRDPWPFSAVVVHGAALAPAQQETLVRYARSGGGLLLAGSFPREPLDAVAPVSFTPDHRVAVVIAVDVSGSMAKDDRLAEIRRAALEAQRLFRPDDLVLPMAFATNQDFIEWKDLPARKAEGETHFAEALRRAGERLAQETTARKLVVMLTDGIPASSETPEARKTAFESLGTARLTVITIDRTLDVGENVRVGDDEAMARELRRALAGIREVERRGTMRVDLHPHEATAGVGPFTVELLNLTTARGDAQLAATVGTAPAVYPALAFRRAGQGLVGAVLFPPAQAPPRLLAQAVRHVARPQARGPRLSIDPPFVRARGDWPSPRLAARTGALAFDLLQVRSDLWEGRLPETAEGSVVVTLPETGAVAVASIAAPPELAALGIDRDALRRMASTTGGREIRDASDLRALPSPPSSGTRPGRPIFLVAAIVLFFLELAVATFWKP